MRPTRGATPLALATDVARAALAVLVAVLVAGSVIALLGYPPIEALRALLAGALGSGPALTATLLKFAPLALTGLAVSLSFRCGVWNIGAEGQLYAGALLATILATRWMPAAPGWIAVPALLAASALGGAVWASIAGALRARRGVSEVISTILLNFIALQLVSLAVHGPLQEATGAYPQSDALTAAFRLPSIGRVHMGVALALLLAGASSVLLFRTSVGFRMRAVGLSETAARFAGIEPERQLVSTLALAGALAGIAGGVEVAGVTGRLYESLSPGYGYTAIAVALLARLHPLAVVPAAFLFAILEAGGAAMQRSAGVPSVATDVLKGVVILLSIGLALGSRRTRGSEPVREDATAEAA